MYEYELECDTCGWVGFIDELDAGNCPGCGSVEVCDYEDGIPDPEISKSDVVMALNNAIPEGVDYYTLLIALSELQVKILWLMREKGIV